MQNVFFPRDDGPGLPQNSGHRIRQLQQETAEQDIPQGIQGGFFQFHATGRTFNGILTSFSGPSVRKPVEPTLVEPSVTKPLNLQCLNLNLFSDFLELRLPTGVAELPNARFTDAIKPGKIRVQPELRIPPQTGFYAQVEL